MKDSLGDGGNRFGGRRLVRSLLKLFKVNKIIVLIRVAGMERNR